MPLPILDVLIYTPAKPGVASRLVDVGDALAVPTAPAAHGAFRTLLLPPSSQMLAWARAGARFDLSRTGATQVWYSGGLWASDCPRECVSVGAMPLEQEDVAYLEAYLLSRDRRWSSPPATGDAFSS